MDVDATVDEVDAEDVVVGAEAVAQSVEVLACGDAEEISTDCVSGEVAHAASTEHGILIDNISSSSSAKKN